MILRSAAFNPVITASCGARSHETSRNIKHMTRWMVRGAKVLAVRVALGRVR